MCDSAPVLVAHTLEMCNVRADQLQQRADHFEQLAATHWQAVLREREVKELTIQHYKGLMDGVQHCHGHAGLELRISKLESMVLGDGGNNK